MRMFNEYIFNLNMLIQVEGKQTIITLTPYKTHTAQRDHTWSASRHNKCVSKRKL